MGQDTNILQTYYITFQKFPFAKILPFLVCLSFMLIRIFPNTSDLLMFVLSFVKLKTSLGTCPGPARGCPICPHRALRTCHLPLVCVYNRFGTED